MIFHKPWPSVICALAFGVAIIIGAIKLFIWHLPVFFLTSRVFKHYFRKQRQRSGYFIKETGKAADQLACACILGGKHDETISNWAGRRFVETGWSSPWPVILIKKITDKMDPPKNGKSHIEDSIEPLRPDIDEGA